MNYILDAHTVLWYFAQNNKLSAKADEIIDNPENTIYVCSATLWEIAIKIALGKLEASFDEILEKLDISGFQVLQIESMFLRDLIDLPQIHKDPFDRLIIATAKREDMTLITADEIIPQYDVRCIW